MNFRFDGKHTVDEARKSASDRTRRSAIGAFASFPVLSPNDRSWTAKQPFEQYLAEVGCAPILLKKSSLEKFGLF